MALTGNHVSPCLRLTSRLQFCSYFSHTEEMNMATPVTSAPVLECSSVAEAAPQEATMLAPLPEAAAAIQADCLVDAEAFLDQVRVTIGGE
jgi:hypothetical protein